MTLFVLKLVVLSFAAWALSSWTKVVVLGSNSRFEHDGYTGGMESVKEALGKDRWTLVRDIVTKVQMGGLVASMATLITFILCLLFVGGIPRCGG